MSHTKDNLPSPQEQHLPDCCPANRQGFWQRQPLASWWLWGIVLLAFALRIVLVHHGLPLLLYEDEPIYYDHSLGFGLGQWDIGYFKKPSFFLYFYGAFYYLAYLYTPFMDWINYVEAFWQDPTYVATVGRSISVLFATGTVFLLGKIGQRAYGWWVGLAAAFLLAVDYTHLRISPIVISDIPALFFITLSAWFALKLSETGARKEYLACAVSIALAISFKYNVFTVFFLLAGHTVYQLSHRNPLERSTTVWKTLLLSRRLWLSLLLIPGLFLLLNPMILKDFSTFWEHLNLEKRHMLQRNTASVTEHWQPMAAFGNIFFKILPRAQGWLPYIGGLLGMVWGLWKYPRPSLVLLSFPIVFLLVVLQFQLINAKYLLPLFPAWYLMTALLLRDIMQLASKSLSPRLPDAASGVLAALLVIGFSFWTWTGSAQYIATYTHADTRNIATDAIKTLVQPHDRLLLEPDTLTLDNRLFRTWLVFATYNGQRFQVKAHSPNKMRQLDLAVLHPRFVVIDFGKAEKMKDSHGKPFYQMPYTPTYYDALLRHYTLKAIFAPYTIHLSPAVMKETLKSQGFGPLYGKIQQHKTSRKRPGPVLVLMERTYRL